MFLFFPNNYFSSSGIICTSNCRRTRQRWLNTNKWSWRNDCAICNTKPRWTIFRTWYVYPICEFRFYFQNELNSFIVSAEDQSRKREIRLQKNREAARECRRKKKEYIKCLENRVAVLENQNKALIEELKSLKELYCQQKSD